MNHPPLSSSFLANFSVHCTLPGDMGTFCSTCTVLLYAMQPARTCGACLPSTHPGTGLWATIHCPTATAGVGACGHSPHGTQALHCSWQGWCYAGCQATSTWGRLPSQDDRVSVTRTLILYVETQKFIEIKNDCLLMQMILLFEYMSLTKVMSVNVGAFSYNHIFSALKVLLLPACSKKIDFSIPRWLENCCRKTEWKCI